MKLEEVYKKGFSYKKKFFYGDVLDVINIHTLPKGIFLLGKTSEETELLWGVDELIDLKEGIEKVKSENKGVNFIFRYADNLNKLLEKKKIISKWGYEEKTTHIGYFCDLNKIPNNYCNEYIEYLKASDINSFHKLEREIFDSMNISKKELIEWMKDDNYIILVYKNGSNILGFLVVHTYGDNNEQCFVRDLGVSKSARKQGIGKNLILHGLNEAKKKGAVKSMLWVDIKNIIARNIYEKIGFKLDENECEVVYRV